MEDEDAEAERVEVPGPDVGNKSRRSIEPAASFLEFSGGTEAFLEFPSVAQIEKSIVHLCSYLALNGF